MTKKPTKLEALIGAALAAPTPQGHLEAFLSIDGTGLPGVTGLRERQERIKARVLDTGTLVLYRINATATRIEPRIAQAAPSRAKWVPRAIRFDRRYRDRARAHETGDAGQAFLLAISYHRHITPMYQSKRAEIKWGYAPESVTDWDAYAKSYGRPANYSNAAYEVTYDASGEARVILHTVRGRRIEGPLRRDVSYDHPGLLDGDLYAGEARPGIAVRYDLRGNQTGYAVSYPSPNRPGDYWEHGDTLAECAREFQRKRARAQEARIQGRPARKARLMARLCGLLDCTVEDARAIGYCRAGIEAFQARYGLGEVATAKQLRATGNPQAARVIQQAALRAVTQEAAR